MWVCICVCGKQKQTTTGALNNGSAACICTRAKDLTGQRFGQLTVLRRDLSAAGVQWICVCDCQTEVIVRAGNLRSGGSKSCGCLKRRSRIAQHIGKVYGRLTISDIVHPARFACVCACGRTKVIRADAILSGMTQSCGCWNTESKRIDLTGRVFERIRVLRLSVQRAARGRPARWECACSCGVLFLAASSDLLRGSVRSCGCLQREIASQIKTKHGEAKPSTKEYQTWIGIRQRCHQPEHFLYPTYGALGVRVCDRWRDPDTGFAAFLADMGRAPAPRYSIDRNRGSQVYGPGTSRWSSKSEQAQNTKSNRYVEYAGESHPAAYWARKHNINYSTFVARLRLGWSVDKALFTSARPFEEVDAEKRRLKLTRQAFDRMWQRCTNKRNPSFQNYGAVGISVCPRWCDFTVFVADVGLMQPGQSPERVNPFDGYHPQNFVWLEQSKQGRNKRNTHWIDVDGARLTLTEAAVRFGLNRTTLSRRLGMGWSVDRALRTPLNSSRKIPFEGKGR